MRVVFAATSRVPNAMAHSHAIARSCEALARLGHDVELWHRRSEEQPGADPAAFHACDPPFAHRELPERWFRSPAPRGPDPARALLFRLGALRQLQAGARLSRATRGDRYLTRQATLGAGIASTGRATGLEVHRFLRGDELLQVRLAIRRGGLRGLFPKTPAIAAALVAGGVPAERVETIPSGVDLRAFAAPLPRAAARRALDLPADVPLVGYVGRLRSGRVGDKGVGTAVAAMAAVARVQPRARLVCVGGPLDAAEPLRRIAAGAGLDGRVEFRPHVPSSLVPTAIRAFDVVVLPLPADDFGLRWSSPMKLFEYAASGAAIVAADTPAVRAVAGDAALLVPPADAGAMGAAIVRLLADPGLATRLGERARAMAAAHSWEAHAARMLARLDPV